MTSHDFGHGGHKSSKRCDTLQCSSQPPSNTVLHRLLGVSGAAVGILQLNRLKKVKTKYVDSALWQVGVLQRVEKKNLKHFLRQELRKIRGELTAAREGVDTFRVSADRYDVVAGVADQDVVTLQLQLRNVVECIKVGRAAVRPRVNIACLRLQLCASADVVSMWFRCVPVLMWS